jgi:hypothetical protein
MKDKEIQYEIEVEARAMQREAVTTNINKERFISEIRNGLGEEIKEKAGQIEVKKPSFFGRIARFFNRLLKI